MQGKFRLLESVFRQLANLRTQSSSGDGNGVQTSRLYSHGDSCADGLVVIRSWYARNPTLMVVPCV
jgi:hypothetical protein